ncbi:MAG TPA: hypothetical protein VHX37_01060 [Acidobacteriaceae bacterium]|jgi:hypothetical protein|nr:hypothetical protein [Acidobacteriaceae bacterium]
MEHPASFVHLAYHSDGDDRDTPTLTVFHDANGIRVLLHPDWRKQVPPPLQPYIEELIADWTATPLDQRPVLMAELAELSTGPLRCLESGNVTEKERTALEKRATA